jgi:hypothetical protein
MSPAATDYRMYFSGRWTVNPIDKVTSPNLWSPDLLRFVASVDHFIVIMQRCYAGFVNV